MIEHGVLQTASQDALVRMLEDERDHYKRELDIMKALRTHSGSLRNAGLTVSPNPWLKVT